VGFLFGKEFVEENNNRGELMLITFEPFFVEIDQGCFLTHSIKGLQTKQ